MDSIRDYSEIFKVSQKPDFRLRLWSIGLRYVKGRLNNVMTEALRAGSFARSEVKLP